MFRVGNTTVDPARRIVRRDGVRHSLSAIEAGLLDHLWAHAGEAVPREALQQHVWRYAPGVVSRAVDQAIRRVRRKLGPDRDHIRPVYGVGYLLDDAVLAAQPPLVGRQAELQRLTEAVALERVVWVVGPPGVGRTRLVRELPPDPDRAVVDDVDSFAPPPTGRWVVLPHLRPTDGAIVELGPLCEADARTLLGTDDARISAELEGLPLGLVHAASQLRHKANLASSLREGLPVHPAVDRSVERRLAAIPAEAQAALAALAVFEGPFPEDAAAAVVGGPAPLPLLLSASLVRRVGDRFALWRIVRSRLRRLGIPADAVARHTELYAELAWSSFVRARQGQERAPDRLLPEVAELRAAAAHDDRAAVGLAWITVVHGPLHEVDAALTRRLEVSAGPLRDELRLARGRVRGRQGADGRADLEAVAACDDPELRIRAGLALASSGFHRGQLDEAAERLARVEQEIERHGAELCLPELWLQRSVLGERSGDPEAARDAAALAAHHAVRLGLRQAASRCFRQRAELAYLAGDLDGAEQWLQHALDGASDVELTYITGSFAALAFARGQLDESEGLYERQLVLARQLAMSPVVPLSALGQVALAREQPERADLLFEEALRWAESAGADEIVEQMRMYRGRAAHLRGDLGAARAAYRECVATEAAGRLHTYRGDLAWQEGDLAGALASYEEALADGLRRRWAVVNGEIRVRLAAVAWLVGDVDRARAVLAAIGTPLTADERAVALVRAAIEGAAPPPAGTAELERFVAARLAEVRPGGGPGAQP
jgi:DNA-binding winged helix-turn-helix (wHTH) protein/tetratricopeptide (TPR) repeat protein